MPPFPKPSKKDRQSQKAAGKADLGSYRRSQAVVAIDRDKGLCTICYFRDGKETPYAEIHHVYGRDRGDGRWREKYTCLLCVCSSCHPLPIQVPGASANLSWVEGILRSANVTPINRKFRRV